MAKNKRKRIVVITVTVDHAIPYHKDLAERMVSSGWEVHFVSSGGANLDGLSEEITKHKLEMQRNPSPLQDLQALIKWLGLLSKIRPTVILAGTPKASLLGIISSKILRVPIRIYWVHGLRLETAEGKLRHLLQRIEWLTARNATSVISVSKSLRGKIINLGISKPEKVLILGEGSTQGVDLNRFVKDVETSSELFLEIGLKTDVPVVGFVGRLTKDKGISELRDAAISLKGSGIQFQLLLVGPVEDTIGEEIQEQLKAKEIDVVVTGRVSDTSSYYKVMNVFCLPSYREGLPNVVLEAFASGVPVVSTEITGVVDIIEDQQTGFLVAPMDSHDLAEALKEVLTDQEFADGLSKRAEVYVRENFDVNLVVSKQIDFIENLYSKIR